MVFVSGPCTQKLNKAGNFSPAAGSAGGVRELRRSAAENTRRAGLKRHAPRFLGAAGVAAILLGTCWGCGPAPQSGPPSVVVYTSVDDVFARQILGRFEGDTGIAVKLLTDTEAGKTTGFLRRLQREAAQPRCDLWWSSEVFGTIELARDGASNAAGPEPESRRAGTATATLAPTTGLFEPYDSPAAADIPPAWKDARHRWTGLAARARVLAFNTSRLSPAELPRTWHELAEPRWASRLAIANPQFGTTRGHVAALYAAWGPEKTRAFLQALRDNGTQIADGNGHAVRLVASGAADLCATDTDDVWSAQARGAPLDLVYPRLTPHGPIVWIPCSVALVHGGPNPQAARKLFDYLVSADAERMLAESDSRNVPVRPALRKELKTAEPWPEPLDYARIAKVLEPATEMSREILTR
jgi:iron(III) transport system substrate-binding protein